jgi:flagellar basal-body rod protein FlgB
VRIFDQTFGTLERALDVRLSRQGVLAGNLANVDTPGFTPRDVDFAAAMGASGSVSPAGIPTSLAGVTLASVASPRGAGELPLELASYTPPSLPGAPRLPGSAMQGISDPPSASPGLDGNSVDADRALVALSENAIQYGAAAKAISKKFAILRYVASDGNA